MERARAALLEAEGKVAEAESAWRRALGSARQEVEVSRALSERSDGVSADRRETSMDNVEISLALNLMRQERLAEAEMAVRNVLTRILTRTGKYSWNTGRAARQFARILFEQGRYADAEKMALAAVEILEHAGVPVGSLEMLQARRTYAAALVAQTRWSDALSVYSGMGSVVETQHKLGNWLARGDVNWALALIKTNRHAEAVPMLESLTAESGARLGHDHYQTAEHRGFLAMALAEGGQRERALKEFAEATRALLARGRVDAEEEAGGRAKTWRRTLILEGYIRLLYDIRGETGERAGFDPAAEAFRLADAARGGNTQRALAEAAARTSAATPALAEVIRKEQDARQQLAVLYQLLLKMLAAPPDQQLPQVVAQMRTRIQELEKERRSLFADLERRFPAYTNLIDPRPATVEEARAALRVGEVLVSVLVADDRTYVWAVPRQGPVGFHAATLGEKALNRQVAHLRRALDPGASMSRRHRDRHRLRRITVGACRRRRPAAPGW